MAQLYCPKCRKTLSDTNFYGLKNGSKSDLCKGCETLQVNNFEPDSFMWLLEKYDIPYLPAEWNKMRDAAYQKNPAKMNGMSVFGKYLSKMKLKQYIDPETKQYYTFADSERLQAAEEEKAKKYGTPQEIMEKKLADMKEAYERGEITEQQWMTYKGINEEATHENNFVNIGGVVSTVGGVDGLFPINNNPFEKIEIPDPAADLEAEDKIYLATRWGRLYSASDWLYLEKKYDEYEESFDLHSADLISGTLQLCKLDLKCNQALDSGDVDSYSKYARASDALRKSLKFTEAQRKEEKDSEFSCYGQIVSFAEMHNDEDFIPPIDLTVDRDMVDEDIRDMKNFNKSLIEEDPAIFKMIEQYIKKRESLAEHEADLEKEDFELSDKDFKEYNDFINGNNNDEEGGEEK